MVMSPFPVLLMPEDVQDQAVVPVPQYGTCDTIVGSTATVRLSTPPHAVVQVSASTARRRQVSVNEYDAGAPGEWLRKSVVGVSNGNYVTGQVVRYNGNYVTIRTLLGEFNSRTVDLEEVAPVLCFLIGKSRLRVEDMNAEELTEQYTEILDRILGTNQRGSRSIPRLLAGFRPVREQPQATDTLRWTNTLTGVESTVSVRHAVDYAFFVDGNRRIPASVRANIGDVFDADPRHTNETTEQPSGEENERDDLETLLQSIGGGAIVPEDSPNPNATYPAAPALSSTETLVPQNCHAKILAAIADDPDLIRFYLGLSQKELGKRPAPPTEQRESQRRRVLAPSDLLDVSEPSERRSKNAFNPTRTQQLIHGIIAGPDHAGKDPSDIVDSMISSRSTKFKPHPAIITRVYDIQFGARGLSIMHFWRFDFSSRRAWYADGSVNLSNFSTSVAMPKARKPESLGDISNALMVLLVFAEEFFDHHTCRLISGSREFVEELRSFCQWSSEDVATLTFWFHRLFEDYRAATEMDARHGTTSRTEIRRRLSLQDPDLQSVLYVIQTERLASLAAVSTKATARTLPSSLSVGTRRMETTRSVRKTPQDVLDALPKQGRLSVCMKHLSSRGCTAKSDDRCAFPNHAHFIPDDLPPVVRKYISAQMGGLREELRQ
ncbi:hypothetical protein DVH05_025902 [Phytophthora capsici]|nr:hypothetical protein DVH05_025902 [Phytophthora capsici]